MTTSLPMAEPQRNALEELIAEAKRIEEDSLFSSKGHFEAASSWGHGNLWIGIPTTILAAISGLSALADYKLIAGVVALAVAALTALFTFLNPRERPAAHLAAGNAYKALHNDARIFHRILCSQSRSSEELSTQLLSLNERRNSLNGKSPQIPRRAFEAAREGIEAGEASYAVDKRRRGDKG